VDKKERGCFSLQCDCVWVVPSLTYALLLTHPPYRRPLRDARAFKNMTAKCFASTPSGTIGGLLGMNRWRVRREWWIGKERE
jgi:hypothetical protein